MSAFHPHLLDRRLGLARGVVWVVVGILILSFFRVQILGHGKYQLQSETNRLRPIPLPAPRGVIYDRNGRVLAENVPGYTVSLLPGPEANLRSTLARAPKATARIADSESCPEVRMIEGIVRLASSSTAVPSGSVSATTMALRGARSIARACLIEAASNV